MLILSIYWKDHIIYPILELTLIITISTF